MKKYALKVLLVFLAVAPVACILSGQPANLRDTVAGIPVNYDNTLAGDYTLPDPLTMLNGEKVKTADEWMKLRRPEILGLFKSCQYGYAPGKPDKLRYEVQEEGTPALDGAAIRKQVSVYLTDRDDWHKMDVVIYLPADHTGSTPLLLYLGFTGNYTLLGDSGVVRGEVWNRDHEKVPAPDQSRFGSIPFKTFLENGFGFASIYYGDIEPDFIEGFPYGIRSVYPVPEGAKSADEAWGAIAAWAWGLGRAMDYFEIDGDIDQGRVALLGSSRLGKTVLWAGASDPRFAMVIASCSGEGGAALSRRNYGETIAHLTAPTRYPYQFCPNYGKYAERVREFPVDAHMLIALVAPRPLLLQTGSEDYWSDPEGEFLAAVAASPVYKLFGEKGLQEIPMPAAGTFIDQRLGYYMHQGRHGFVPADFPVFIEFMKKHL